MWKYLGFEGTGVQDLPSSDNDVWAHLAEGLAAGCRHPLTPHLHHDDDDENGDDDEGPRSISQILFSIIIFTHLLFSKKMYKCSKLFCFIENTIDI